MFVREGDLRVGAVRPNERKPMLLEMAHISFEGVSVTHGVMRFLSLATAACRVSAFDTYAVTHQARYRWVQRKIEVAFFGDAIILLTFQSGL